MALTDYSVFAALRTKLKWHQSRQTMLAQNVANADTPKYRARDLAPVDFSKDLSRAGEEGVVTSLTHRTHIEGVAASTFGKFRAEYSGGFEVTPEGNEVVLEEQMMKVTSNQMDYQLASTLYNRSLGLLKIAVNRRG
jgi:flagellar basal-body rod protein FlgB